MLQGTYIRFVSIMSNKISCKDRKDRVFSAKEAVMLKNHLTSLLLILFTLPAHASQQLRFSTPSTNPVPASFSFQNLFSSICWLGGIVFFIRGCIGFLKLLGAKKDDATFRQTRKTAAIHLLLGLGLIAIPISQAWLFQTRLAGSFGLTGSH